jgi:hypothetical protein
MALSNDTYDKLASALKEDVIRYIESDERYVEFMLDIIPDAVNQHLGEVDYDVISTLSFCIMDKIILR